MIITSRVALRKPVSPVAASTGARHPHSPCAGGATLNSGGEAPGNELRVSFLPCETDQDSPCPFDPPVQPRCPVQLAAQSKTLPNRVPCHPMAYATTIAYAHKKVLVPQSLSSDDILRYGLVYVNTWPLPIGRLAIADWRTRVGFKTKQQAPAGWPPPQTEDDHAFLGLAIERRVIHDSDRASSIWLLGLVKRVPRLSEQRYTTYRFTEPLVHTESRARTNRERSLLVATDRELWQWYTKRILKQRISEGGRPVGTTETFSDMEHFRSVIRQVIGALQSQGLYPSAERVAQYLGQHPKGIGFRGAVAELDIRQLRRYRERSGYKSWKELLRDLSG